MAKKISRLSKWVVAVIVIVAALSIFFASPPASALTDPVTPQKTPPTLPSLPPPAPTALLGEFDMDLWNGSENQEGQVTDLDFVTFRISVYDSSINEDGTEWYYGSIAGHRGSHVTISRSPELDEMTIWVFTPTPPLGWFSGYYLQFEVPLFITSPNEASGAMLGRFKHRNEMLIIYHSDVRLCKVGKCKA